MTGGNLGTFIDLLHFAVLFPTLPHRGRRKTPASAILASRIGLSSAFSTSDALKRLDKLSPSARCWRLPANIFRNLSGRGSVGINIFPGRIEQSASEVNMRTRTQACIERSKSLKKGQRQAGSKSIPKKTGWEEGCFCEVCIRCICGIWA